ncbi:MAG: sterol carrier family protein [Actinomycetota bacterium]
MARKLIPDTLGLRAIQSYIYGDEMELATAVRYLLQLMENRYPGGSVELRVPPYGAIQCIEGSNHKRGTPSNVVELGAAEWVQLATGRTTFEQLLNAGKLQASGNRSDLAGLFPIFES